jgi:hypothetical protein
MPSKLAAFKIFRRSATVAIFTGHNLDFVDIHHLSNVPKVASEALGRFVGWVVENFQPHMAALSTDEDEQEGLQRTQLLTELAECKLLELGVPIWRITDAQLLESYSVPAFNQKHELRALARSIWPYVATQHIPALDAALVGLYAQVERLLSDQQ